MGLRRVLTPDFTGIFEATTVCLVWIAFGQNFRLAIREGRGCYLTLICLSSNWRLTLGLRWLVYQPVLDKSGCCGPDDGTVVAKSASLDPLWGSCHYRVWERRDEGPATRSARSLIEPIFGILKEQLGARRFLLWRLVNIRAEFTLLASALKLWTLWRVWRTYWRPTVAEGIQHLNLSVYISG